MPPGMNGTDVQEPMPGETVDATVDAARDPVANLPPDAPLPGGRDGTTDYQTLPSAVRGADPAAPARATRELVNAPVPGGLKRASDGLTKDTTLSPIEIKGHTGGGAGGAGGSPYGERADLVEAQRKIGEAERTAGLNRAITAQVKADYLQQAQDEAANREAIRLKKEQDRQFAAEEHQKKIELAVEEAKDWELNQGTFLDRNPGGLLMGLGAVFGSVLAARTGQPNEALQMLDKEIDRDLQRQKFAYQRKRDNVDAQKTLYGVMRDRFSDERDAEKAAEIAQRSLVQQRLETLQAQAQPGAERDAVGVMLAHNNMEMGKLQNAEYDRKYKEAMAAQARADAAQKHKEQLALENRKIDLQERHLLVEEKKADAAARAHAEQRAEENVTGYGKALADRKVEAKRQNLGELKGLIEKYGYVPGVGFAAGIKQKLDNPLARAIGNATGVQPPLIPSDVERVGHTAWEQALLHGKVDVTGLGGPEKELATIYQALGGAQTPAEQKALIQRGLDVIKQIEADAGATYGGAPTVEAYRKRRESVAGPQMPASVQLEEK
jgi:hypothetical protein